MIICPKIYPQRYHYNQYLLYMYISLVDGTLRLNGRTTGFEGILEIYHSNRWGSICDDGWDEVASEVACKQMGFREYISYSTSSTITNKFWLDDVRCNGDETSITSCSTLPWGDENCGSSEGIFLRCQHSGIVPYDRDLCP